MPYYIAAVFDGSVVIFSTWHCHISENPRNTLLKPNLKKSKRSKAQNYFFRIFSEKGRDQKFFNVPKCFERDFEAARIFLIIDH